MYQVMRSIRMNCFGDKPCELEMLSDASETFQGAFNHVNYEDLDMNVAIPIFSIHGNHDDPSGEGHLAALDLLQVSGLLNYYGRTPESDNIEIKPVLLQKGRTKLALYGMSNVRDERMFRTFRDGKVKFFKPSVQKDDWFNLMSVHQNHHAYTETGYLPENFLPEFMDLVIWGHEHECLIHPRLNPEMKFHVMQPGSSVATSLVPGEAVPKQVSIVSVTGREFKCEPVRLKTVRPFVMREIILSEEKGAQKLARKDNNRTEVTRFLMSIVEELIEEAKQEWLETQEEPEEGDHDEESREIPLPLVRLRVEISTPDGGAFECENPQRFSNRFVGKVANVNDVVQFHRKKKGASRKKDDTDEVAVSHLEGLDTVKVDQLVKEFLASQSLSILPQNTFGDAVAQFIDKDDKHAMEMFVNESLQSQVKHLMSLDGDADDMDDDEQAQSSLMSAMEKYRNQMEDLFSKGAKSRPRGKRRFKPKPDGWDSDFDGVWEDQPGALIHSDDGGDPAEEEAGEDGSAAAPSRATKPARGRGRGRGARSGAASTRGASKAAAAPSRSRRKKQDSEEESAGDDVIMLDNDDDDEIVDVASEEDDSQSLFVKQPRAKASTRAGKAASTTTRRRGGRAAASPAPSSITVSGTATRRAPARSARPTQTTLDFSNSQASAPRGARAGRTTRHTSVVSDDDDDDDAFEPI